MRVIQQLPTWALGALVAALTVLAAGALAAPGKENQKARVSSSRHQAITAGLDCSACHTPHGWKQVGDSASAGGFDHSRTGFPLTGRHQQTACTGCHGGQRKVTRECVGCHVDAHQRRLGEQCDDCHSSTSFLDVRGLELHRLTRLPLTGMHALADCTACHQRIGERRFSSVPADCFACHAREYRRSDIHPLHVGSAESAPFPRDCAQCHRATGWAPAVIAPGALTARTNQALTRAPANHDLVFPISFGSHRSAQCADCHRSEKLSRAVQCTGCHAHSPVRLMKLHESVPGFQASGACLHCHPGGAAR